MHLITTFALCFKYFCIASGVILTTGAIFAVPVYYGSGKTTKIELIQNFAANVNASVWVAWGAAAAAGVGYVRERKARLQERELKDNRLRAFESHINPDVTSSNLTLTGEKVQNEGPKL